MIGSMIPFSYYNEKLYNIIKAIELSKYYSLDFKNKYKFSKRYISEVTIFEYNLVDFKNRIYIAKQKLKFLGYIIGKYFDRNGWLDIKLSEKSINFCVVRYSLKIFIFKFKKNFLMMFKILESKIIKFKKKNTYLDIDITKLNLNCGL